MSTAQVLSAPWLANCGRWASDHKHFPPAGARPAVLSHVFACDGIYWARGQPQAMHFSRERA
jgi:hypothetical protein